MRPWSLSDADFVMDGSQPLDPRKTVFVGGVPRPLRAGIFGHFFLLSLFFCSLAVIFDYSKLLHYKTNDSVNS